MADVSTCRQPAGNCGSALGLRPCPQRYGNNACGQTGLRPARWVLCGGFVYDLAGRIAGREVQTTLGMAGCFELKISVSTYENEA